MRIVSSVAPLHHFAVAGSVHIRVLSVCAILQTFVPVKRRVSNKATSQQISVREKQPVANERRNQHNDV